ncbi:hypothetical protein [Streptomyces noursei]|uniref:hypothetical protein n=1 Tax=Streptomyces noursei TaxID=1971 RepID=UPI001964AB9B|nr:hypothetical protein [Streptomyces noursei]QRX90242.1 hypothetical protein JNO44_04650 [Streptomyces noursei]
MGVLRVIDGRTHHLVELPVLRRGVLRMCVHLSCPGLVIGAVDLRALLVGDVLFRAAETAGVQARHNLVVPELPPEQVKALDRATAALGINLSCPEFRSGRFACFQAALGFAWDR